MLVMRNGLISFLLGLGLSTLFVFSSCAPKETPDCGFVQNVYGQRISWKDKKMIEFIITAEVPVELRSAIYRAAATWHKNLGRKVFEISEESLHDGLVGVKPSRDKKNAIYFLQNWESDKKSEQGRTSVYWAGDEIQEADIKVNAQDFSYYNENTQQVVPARLAGHQADTKKATAYSFEALVLHEMGHFLGLKHRDDGESVMGTYLAAFTNRTELSLDDVGNAQCEYK